MIQPMQTSDPAKNEITNAGTAKSPSHPANQRWVVDLAGTDRVKWSRDMCKAFGRSRGKDIAESIAKVEGHVNQSQLGLSPLGIQYRH